MFGSTNDAHLEAKGSVQPASVGTESVSVRISACLQLCVTGFVISLQSGIQWQVSFGKH